jgi:hypothetical protein
MDSESIHENFQGVWEAERFSDQNHVMQRPYTFAILDRDIVGVGDIVTIEDIEILESTLDTLRVICRTKYKDGTAMKFEAKFHLHEKNKMSWFFAHCPETEGELLESYWHEPRFFKRIRKKSEYD